MNGPLDGLRVVEMGGIGPAPFCADAGRHGATVLRIQRPGSDQTASGTDPRFDVLARNRPALSIDLRSSHGTEQVLKLLDNADLLIEAFRPGVMEPNNRLIASADFSIHPTQDLFRAPARRS